MSVNSEGAQIVSDEKDNTFRLALSLLSMGAVTLLAAGLIWRLGDIQGFW